MKFENILAQLVFRTILLEILQLVLEYVDATEQAILVDHRLPVLRRILPSHLNDFVEIRQFAFQYLFALHRLLDKLIEPMQIFVRYFGVADAQVAALGLTAIGQIQLQ